MTLSAVLLDPAKEEFYLPPRLVERGDLQSRERGAVGDEQEALAGLGIFVANAAEALRIVLGGLIALQHQRLIEDDACRAVHGVGVTPLVRSGLLSGVAGGLWHGRVGAHHHSATARSRFALSVISNLRVGQAHYAVPILVRKPRRDEGLSRQRGGGAYPSAAPTRPASMAAS